MSKKSDLQFIRLISVLAHLALIYGFVRLLWASLSHFTEHDASIRSVFRANGCVSYFAALEDIIVQSKFFLLLLFLFFVKVFLFFLNIENESGKQVLFHLAFSIIVLVALLLLLANNSILIGLYVLFEMSLLGFNLRYPILEPYMALAYIFTSTAFNLLYTGVQLLPDFNKHQAPKPVSLRYRPTTPTVARATAPDLEALYDEEA